MSKALLAIVAVGAAAALGVAAYSLSRGPDQIAEPGEPTNRPPRGSGSGPIVAFANEIARFLGEEANRLQMAAGGRETIPVKKLRYRAAKIPPGASRGDFYALQQLRYAINDFKAMSTNIKLRRINAPLSQATDLDAVVSKITADASARGISI